MLMFTLAISCLTTSNLPSFMNVTFQVPMQYFSLPHWTLLWTPVTSTAGHCFCFGSISSFFLESFLHWSPVVYWAPTDLGSSSVSVLSFCLFILFMGFSRQEYWSDLPFPSLMDCVLSELSTVTHRGRDSGCCSPGCGISCRADDSQTECLGVSSGGVGWWWPAAGSRACCMQGPFEGGCHYLHYLHLAHLFTYPFKY